MYSNFCWTGVGHRYTSIAAWPWQLVATYIDGMGEICRHAESPSVRRQALGGLSLHSQSQHSHHSSEQVAMGMLDMLCSSDWPSGKQMESFFSIYFLFFLEHSLCCWQKNQWPVSFCWGSISKKKTCFFNWCCYWRAVAVQMLVFGSLPRYQMPGFRVL